MPAAEAEIDVVYEDNHLLIVNKPAELPTMGVAADRPSLLSIAKAYVARKYNKPGNVYLGIVSRLDAPVTGLVVIARTSKAANRLTTAFRERQVSKRYWAIVAGSPEPSTAKLEHFLRKDERHRRVHTTHGKAPGAQVARLSYEVIATAGEHSLLEIELETGRKHQIRVQLAKVGHSILGDRKYGSRDEFPAGIALHSRRLEIPHPVRDEVLTLVGSLPASWKKHRTADRLVALARK